jgi:hypothetical protein
VFYVDSNDDFSDWNYLEIAPAGWYGASPLSGSWCSNDNATEFGGTSSGIGAGKTNFEVMVANCTGIADAVDEYVSEYLGLRLSDWYIPSNDEINTAYTALNSSGQWPGDGWSWYWASTEAGNNARNFYLSLQCHPSDSEGHRRQGDSDSRILIRFRADF